MCLWGGWGGNFLILSAGLQNVPGHLYEAADIDGAKEFIKFIKITLPHLWAVIVYLLIMEINGTMQSYADAEIFAQGSYEAQTIVYFIWQKGIKSYNYGIASAASTLLAIVMFFITFVQFRLQQKKGDE